MTGLLYKDFKAIRGHYYLIGILSFSLFLLISRIFFCSAEIDVIVAMLITIAPFALVGMLLAKIELGIIAADEDKNTQLYLLSLPITSKIYIASKYWFMLIGSYVILSICTLWGIIYRIQMADEGMEELVVNIISLLPPIMCTVLCLVAIELPFFVLLGSKRGQMIKMGILLGLMFACFVFLLFGDLTLLNLLDLQKLFRFLEEHTELLFILQIFSPIISLVLYYCSYRLTCSIFERKEICYES